MGNKMSQTSGYSIRDVENEETVWLIEEEEKPLDAITSSSSSTNSSNIWRGVKPFVNGGLAGLIKYSLYLCTNLLLIETLPPNMHKRMPGALLIEATFASMQFGSFETLKQKVEAANKRMPLTLYQEACCGLTSGAVTAFVCVPMLLAESRVKAGGHHISLFQDLYRKCANEGVLAIWKGGWPQANVVALVSIGMLTPYNQCFNYFRESFGLRKQESILGAGLVSGFFALACSMPYRHVYSTMIYMKPHANGKYPFSSFLDCAMKILKSRGPLGFFTGFPVIFHRTASQIMIFWLVLEAIRECEEKHSASNAIRSSAIVGGSNEIVNDGFSDTAEE